jgi:hypothetical protein
LPEQLRSGKSANARCDRPRRCIMGVASGGAGRLAGGTHRESGKGALSGAHQVAERGDLAAAGTARGAGSRARRVHLEEAGVQRRGCGGGGAGGRLGLHGRARNGAQNAQTAAARAAGAAQDAAGADSCG